MKILIASDIHGSAYWCRKLAERFSAEDAQRLVLLGDLLYHGPRNNLPCEYAPKEVITILNSLKASILAVRGNCDAEVDQMVLEFPIMADYALLAADGLNIFCTHGHLFNPTALPPLRDGDILLNGHTHLYADELINGFRYINPGSVSLPKEGRTGSYMVLDNGIFTLKDMDGNIISL